MLRFLKKFCSRQNKEEPEEKRPYDGGCMYCNFFNGHGCSESGLEFPSWLNISVKPYGCPIVDVQSDDS